MRSRKEELKKEKLQDDMLRDIRYVAINDNVYKISEQDCLDYDNLNIHPDNYADDLCVKWCDKMIAKYKPIIFLEIIVRND